MEAITLKCPHCGAMLTVPDTYIGRTSKCGRCRTNVVIAAPQQHVETRPNVRARPWYETATNAALIFLVVVLLAILITFFV